jgi:aspartate carbamoyltransferase catalytic subunit
MPASVLEEVTRLGGVAPREYASLDQMVDGAAVISTVDAIYVTRIQRERFASEAGFAAVSGSYAITEELLQRAKPDCLILHPLPRIDELAYGLDQDPRAAYFRQAAYGLPVRMALIASLLAIGEAPAPAPRTGVVSRPGLRCANAKCVMSTERYLEPEFQAVPGRETVRCAYCEQEVGA